MEYINIKLETLGDIRFVGARPVMRSTWLSLLAYCAKQENSGRIANCHSRGNDTWAQIACLRKAEVHTPCGLWEWDGDDVVVWSDDGEHLIVVYLQAREHAAALLAAVADTAARWGLRDVVGWETLRRGVDGAADRAV